MADDPERDIFPTKEVPLRHMSPGKHFIPHSSRTDLEDQFYKFKEENLELKKAAKKQEEELKRLATKMTRLLREKKSLELPSSPGHKRDLELEEMVEDLQDKVRQLEKSNTQLREKVLVAKHQVITQVRRPNPYCHVPPKVNSGNLRATNSPYISSISLKGKCFQNISKAPNATPLPAYAMNLLEEARTELSNLKMLVYTQRNEIEMYQQENEVLKQKMRMREIEFEEEINNLKSELTQRQRQHVQENLDLIRLHREIKQKNSKMLSMQAHFGDMEEKMRILKLNHDRLVKDMDELTLHFKNEQKKNIELLGQLHKAELNCSASSDLQERIKSIMKENDLLRENNDKLIKNALVVEQEKSHTQKEQILNDKILNLEKSLELELKSKAALEEELIKEKSVSASKEEAYNLLKNNFVELKSCREELDKKINFLQLEEEDFNNLQEALKSLKLNKTNNPGCQKPSAATEEANLPCTKEPIKNKEKDCEQSNLVKSEGQVDGDGNNNGHASMAEEELKDDKEEIEDLQKKLDECEADHLETIKELNNVREMLITQCDINKVSQEEIKSLTEKIEEQQKDYESKLEEYSHLLDIRATRIQKLEKQLNDIAYGTKTLSLSSPTANKKVPDLVELSRGENIFEIHILKVSLTDEGIRSFHSSNSKVFLTWNFYEFELQSTPVVSIKKTNFNFTAQYTLEVDDYFLCYLHENSATLELHESYGVEYRTLATCQLNFSNIFRKYKERVYGSGKLIGINSEGNHTFGTVEYWINLKIPMEEAFKSFQEKMKALKYIHSNKDLSKTAMKLLKQPQNPSSLVNELHIKILRGINIKSQKTDVQPTTFCVYKFFDLPDQDSVTVPASNNPEYSDHHIFSLYINPSLQKYLSSENLYIYVFDDNDSDVSNHIGRASIPLQPLILNKPIKGVFELYKDEKSGYGSLEVLLYWQYDYNPPSVSAETSRTEDIMKQQLHETSSSEDEVASDSQMEVTTDAPPVPKPRTSIPCRKITSTPLTKPLGSSSDEDSPLTTPNLSPVIHAEGRRNKIKEPSMSSQLSIEASSQLPSSFEKIPEEDEDAWSDVMSDTDKRASYEDVSENEKHSNSSLEESDESETESDYSAYKNKIPIEQLPKIRICVSHLELNPDAAVLQDPMIKLLYVEYRFLDYPLEELETPFSLPKKASPEKIAFNFDKVFTLKPKDLEKWNLLSKMFTSDSPESSLIKFTVVSEPTSDEQDLDCEDIGWGALDLREILERSEDIEEDISIYDAENSNTKIGTLRVTIQALDALLLLQTFVES